MRTQQNRQKRYVGLRAVKSTKRVAFIEGVVRALTSPEVYEGLPRKSYERDLVDRAYPILLKKLEYLYRKEDPGRVKQSYVDKAKRSLVWEHDPDAVLNHTYLFGTQHRPDMLILHNRDYRIAIEYKMVSSGDSLRAALGQSLVYASDYEFTICLLCDTTQDGGIFKKYDQRANGPEGALLDELWKSFGTKVVVVNPWQRASPRR